MSATTIFTNARIFPGATTTPPTEWHTTMAIRDEHIIYTGASSSPELTSITSGAATTTHDLHGAHIFPGFIDAHMHFLLFGQSLHKVNLDGSRDLNEIRARIRSYAAAHPDKERILAMGWMHSMTDGQARADMLDDLDPRPIYIDAKDLHSVWCSSAALREMGVTRETADPAGGTIERDSRGEPAGLLSEACVLLVVWPFLARVLSVEEKVGAFRAAVQAYAQVGVTGCVDMAMDENAWEALVSMRDTEGLPMRVAAHWCIVPGDGEEERLRQVERAIELAAKFSAETSPDLRVVGIKIICDGVVDACTAALSEPYSTNGHFENPIWTPEMLDPVVKKAADAGLQCALHAIGDKAVHNAVNVLEKHGRPGQRHRIEHLEVTAPEDAARLGKLGITASIQPVHSDPSIIRAWPNLLGPERVKRAFAYSEFAEGDAQLAIGTDTPTAPYAPLSNLYVATTRRSAREPEAGDEPVNENFRLGLGQAVNAATAGAAYSCFADGRVGSLEVGKLADFCVVDTRWDGEELLEARVLETWFGGRKVYGVGQ